jgi:O-antigen ligase
MRGPQRTLGRLALGGVFLPLVLVLALFLSGAAVARVLEAKVAATYLEGGQGSYRMALWQHALQAWSTSPLVGLGPGGHSGRLAPFGEVEAHNTFIDWTASSGLVGLLAYAALLLWLFRQVLWSQSPPLVAALAGLVGYSVFHYVLRQPLFWIELVWLCVLARSAREAARAATHRAEPPPPLGTVVPA